MRKNIKRGLVAAATAALALGLAMGSAQADPSFVPDANDIVGTGSDTTQGVTQLLAEGYNATSPTPARQMASFHATGGGQITLRAGSTPINRPNGSSAGINTLLGNADASYARASRSITTAEAGSPNNLRQYPFAYDGLQMVGNASQTGSPASVTAADLVGIYQCDITTWDDAALSAPGTSSATIHPKLPQLNSGTRQFFLDQLTIANGGTPITVGGCVDQTVQEHDPNPVINDVDGIVPFSSGRFDLLTDAEKAQLKVFGGFLVNRVLYHVVRLASTTDAGFTAIFGSAGYICSPAGQAIVTAQGFKSLPSGCGVARSTPLTPPGA
jgi:ABC-type phosphate transport system substrate-binding protein